MKKRKGTRDPADRDLSEFLTSRTEATKVTRKHVKIC
jgi:hypothetical protein